MEQWFQMFGTIKVTRCNLDPFSFVVVVSLARALERQSLILAHHLSAIWTTPATKTARLVTASALHVVSNVSTMYIVYNGHQPSQPMTLSAADRNNDEPRTASSSRRSSGGVVSRSILAASSASELTPISSRSARSVSRIGSAPST